MIIEMATILIIVHTVDGYEVQVNPEMVTTLRVTREDNAKDKLVADKVRCVVGLADGKFVSVRESCDAVRQLVEGNR